MASPPRYATFAEAPFADAIKACPLGSGIPPSRVFSPPEVERIWLEVYDFIIRSSVAMLAQAIGAQGSGINRSDSGSLRPDPSAPW